MRKLLTILLLFPLFSFSQISVTPGWANGFNTAGIGTIGGGTFTAGRLYILFIATTAASTPGNTTVTSASTTWTQISTVLCNTTVSPTVRLTAYRFLPSSTVSETLTITTSGGQTGAWVYGYEVTRMLTSGTNGSDAVAQSGKDSSNASLHPGVTLSALQNGATVLFAFANSLNPPAGTAEAGWSEIVDSGFNTPTTGGYSMYRTNTTDNTPSSTAATLDNWGAIAVEIRGGRRVFNVQ